LIAIYANKSAPFAFAQKVDRVHTSLAFQASSPKLLSPAKCRAFFCPVEIGARRPLLAAAASIICWFAIVFCAP
jgi:hypothetical protein